MSIELAILEPEYLDVFAEPSLSSDIESLLDQIGSHELKLATSYVQLGILLLRAEQEKFWGGRESYARYLGYIAGRINRARSQMYAYVDVAKRLLPFVSKQDLEHMGISRAQELTRYVKQSGLKVPQHLLEAALDDSKKISQLHVEVLQALNEKGETVGVWFDPFGGGFYATDEEKKEIRQAMDRAKSALDAASDAAEHIVRKEIVLAFAREFLSSNPQ